MRKSVLVTLLLAMVTSPAIASQNEWKLTLRLESESEIHAQPKSLYLLAILSSQEPDTVAYLPPYEYRRRVSDVIEIETVSSSADTLRGYGRCWSTMANSYYDDVPPPGLAPGDSASYNVCVPPDLLPSIGEYQVRCYYRFGKSYRPLSSNAIRITVVP